MDSVRKLLTGGLHEAVALCLLLSVVFGGLGQTMHKSLTRRYGATATRLMSNLQAVVAWVFAIALFYIFRSDPLFHGIGGMVLPYVLKACSGFDRTISDAPFPRYEQTASHSLTCLLTATQENRPPRSLSTYLSGPLS